MAKNQTSASSAQPSAAFQRRLDARRDEIADLYRELYGDDAGALDYFFQVLTRNAAERKLSLRKLDDEREADPYWYRSQKIVGMELYPARFAQTLRGLQQKLDYFEELGVNYLYLMAVLACPPGRDDGGFAVSDYRSVQPQLGTMDDLDALCEECARRGIDLCMDFSMNHTSEDHPWARSARAGNPVDRARYFFFDDWGVPDQYDQMVPQVFPENAPGNFTYLDDCNQVVMTTFYPYQWDLNYANPMVLNDMMDNLLFLANRGLSFIRLNTVPYLWKTLGTSCRNLPQVHRLMRLFRLACEVVCPAMVLLGEVVMEPTQVFPYFGMPSRPECQLLYNVTAMCTAWNSLATQDARLLQRQAGQLAALGPGCAFVNYVRCHDDIGWGLDYPALASQGMQERSHKSYLNEWFTGAWPGSWARGELYNADPSIEDARLCGTTASLCGVEAAFETHDRQALDLSLRRLLCLHGWLLCQSGIPVIYSGDEIAQLNDYSYHEDPEKADDSRYLQRRDFCWEEADRRHDETTVEGRIFSTFQELIRIRREEPLFREDARVDVLTLEDKAVLGLRRCFEDETLVAYFNFSGEAATVSLPEGAFVALTVADSQLMMGALTLPAWGFVWLKRVSSEAS